MNRFKINFTQQINGIEYCEAVIEAENQVEALAKFEDRDFTIYLATKSDVQRVAGMDDVQSIEQVN